MMWGIIRREDAELELLENIELFFFKKKKKSQLVKQGGL